MCLVTADSLASHATRTRGTRVSSAPQSSPATRSSSRAGLIGGGPIPPRSAARGLRKSALARTGTQGYYVEMRTDATPGAAPIILDCTIRDGSYAIDFKFTAEDTALIAEQLDRAGLQYIEVGHGLGLGASEAGKGKAASRDLDVI